VASYFNRLIKKEESETKEDMDAIRNIIAILGLLLGTVTLRAQAPDWTVNPGEYQYTMTIVAFLHVDNKLLVGPKDKVAAFSGGKVRGVASPIFVSSANRYLTYLTVFSNKENEKIEFKIYESASGKTSDITATLNFKIDAQLGNIFQAFSLANPPLSSEAKITNFSFTGVDSVSTIIEDEEVNIVLEYDQDLHNLSPEFEISKGAKMYIDRTLQESGKATRDFLEPRSYSILSEDESVLITYQVNVSNRQTSYNGFTSTNVITANNDGLNDYWVVEDVFKYNDADFKILDVNGRILFQSTGYKNDWDGFYKGIKLSRGKYYYVIKNPKDNTIIKGDILVLY
jgi:gliding motility-associated-like protein